MYGRTSGVVRSFALYGDTTGETDEFGLPAVPWAEDYRGDATVVYGHTPVPEAVWINRTICIDTGCVFGGKLTALRYPERELISVPAADIYYEPVRPLVTVTSAADEPRVRGELDLTDVTGKRIVSTRLTRTVTIREENAIAALEVMSRFAIDPRWLPYLPPTMAPTRTSRRPGLLEHPEDAFDSYRADGVATVVCEEKHMGSRAIVVLCRDEAAAARWFVAGTPSMGAIYTRTGRPFFPDQTVEHAMLDRDGPRSPQRDCGMSSDRPAAARLRASSVVRKGRRAPANAIRARRRRSVNDPESGVGGASRPGRRPGSRPTLLGRTNDRMGISTLPRGLSGVLLERRGTR